MPGHKPTILQVIPALDTGGAERTAIDVAEALVSHGFGSVVASEGGRLLVEITLAVVLFSDAALANYEVLRRDIGSPVRMLNSVPGAKIM